MMAHILGIVGRSMVIALALILAACAPAQTHLSGTELDRSAAPDFTLTDGLSGGTVTLSSLRGNVVAMAFLYTHCPDVCPLTAGLFRAAQKSLGADAARVRFVAVSVDPVGDTPQSVRSFSEEHDLSTNWHYLIGPRAELQTVWSAYGIGAFDAGTGKVDHNDAIYLIDASGREREIVHSDTALADLVNDLRTVMKNQPAGGTRRAMFSDARARGSRGRASAALGVVTEAGIGLAARRTSPGAGQDPTSPDDVRPQLPLRLYLHWVTSRHPMM